MTSRWRTRDYVLTTSICFLFLVLVHQARTRSSLSDIQSALEQTREVAVDLRMEHQRIQTKLQALEAAYATANPTRPLPPLPPAPAAAAAPASTGQHLPAAAAVLQPLEPISLHVPTNGTLGCLGWRQTGGCDPTGPREDAHDHDCATKVMSEWSGYCECEGGVRAAAVGCSHSDFTCNMACEDQLGLDAQTRAGEDGAGEDGALVLKWKQLIGRPVATDPDKLPTAEYDKYVQTVAGLTQAHCPAGSEQFYKNVPLVYTWVNGSELAYQKLRETAGGAKAVGGARDRDNGELRFSIRSLAKFMPWWNGTIYIVAPNQTPSWIDTSHPRLKIVDQDDLFPEADKDILPQFNTNAIEQWLWRMPGVNEVFVHVNDDYIFTSRMEPQDLFGPTCGGMRLLQEKGVIKHRDQKELKGMLEKGGRTWLNSVASSIFALDKRYNARQSKYPYLKHSPFVYSRKGCKAVTTEFRAEMRTTMEHKFRNGGDVIMPLIHHGYMRAEGAAKNAIDLSVAPQDEMGKFILLSLSGDEPIDPKNPKKKTAAMEHAAQRASKWYGKILDGSTPTKMVTLNDEMGGNNNLTVVAQFHHFALAILPDHSEFEVDSFVPEQMPDDAKGGHLEFDIEDHQPGFLEKLKNGFFSARPKHDADDGMRRSRH